MKLGLEKMYFTTVKLILRLAQNTGKKKSLVEKKLVVHWSQIK